MRRLRLAMALAAFVGLPPVSVRCELSHVPETTGGPASISDMTDVLQRIQVRMTQGDSAAYPETVALLKTIATAIAAAPPETWKDKRESDSLVIYILSGGPLAEIVPLLRNEGIPAGERRLAQGAVAYMTGHEADALELLHTVDVKALDSRLSGEIAFACALLEFRRDPKAATDSLDWARLVAPGSLVEEVALRREIGLFAEMHDSTRMALLIRQYVNRFSRSVYAPEFLRGFGRMVAQEGLADDAAHYRRLSQAAAALSPDARRDFLLGLAKTETVNGRFDAAEAAATDALSGAAPGSPQESRARLYLAAGRIFTGEPEAARVDLQTLNLANLDHGDAALLASARSVAAQVRLTPTQAAIDAQAEAMSKDRSGAGATIAAAEGALQKTASLVEGVSP
jgi:chemotaxis protein MotC